MLFKAALLLALFAPSVTGRAVDCSDLYQEHLRSDLNLPYEAFDQTMDSGFRPLAAAGCRKEAADLIEIYIAENNADERSLKWHVAQLRAMTGDYESAVRFARGVLDEEEDLEVRTLRWNDYVLATIAFLEKDREALRYHRDEVEKGVDEHDGNRLNLRLLDSLIRNFEQSYDYALRNIE